MAKRRKFIAGMGSLAVGAAAATGTGAFTSAQAERSATVQVSGDSNAYLGVNPKGPYAEIVDGQIKLNFDSSGDGGNGLNADATTYFEPIMELTNQAKGDEFIAVNLAVNNTGLTDPYSTTHLGEESGIESVGAFKEPANTGSYEGGIGLIAGGDYGLDRQGGVPVIESSVTGRVDTFKKQVLKPGDSLSVGMSVSTADSLESTFDSRITVMGVQVGGNRDNAFNSKADFTGQTNP